MPKLYVYFGLVVYFYANEHEPVHVHGEYHGQVRPGDIQGILAEATREDE